MSREYQPTSDSLLEALEDVKRVRNVCVIAHVDHGKTSLCDHLIASNGYLSQWSAGKARFMDSREDEQSRFITIKSSAIPLLHNIAGVNHVINLIDSPGHIDFSAEVSAAARLCDGALLIVDVLEGFASQSKTVMRQACKEGVSLLLILNKMDRLFVEARLTPSEIYIHVRDLLETINATLQKLLQEEELATDIDELDKIFEQRCFSPEKGNVVFASAIHGWAFDMRCFSRLLAQKILKMNFLAEGKFTETEKKLRSTFWGNYSLDMKTLKISTKSSNKNNAISFALDPIFEVYALAEAPSLDKARIISQKLNLDISEAEFRKWSASPLTLPSALLSRWLPCSTNILVYPWSK